MTESPTTDFCFPSAVLAKSAKQSSITFQTCLASRKVSMISFSFRSKREQQLFHLFFCTAGIFVLTCLKGAFASIPYIEWSILEKLENVQHNITLYSLENGIEWLVQISAGIQLCTSWIILGLLLNLSSHGPASPRILNVKIDFFFTPQRSSPVAEWRQNTHLLQFGLFWATFRYITDLKFHFKSVDL